MKKRQKLQFTGRPVETLRIQVKGIKFKVEKYISYYFVEETKKKLDPVFYFVFPIERRGIDWRFYLRFEIEKGMEKGRPEKPVRRRNRAIQRPLF